jgi:uncharacterized protein involved in type VI secretion and phage assembly
MADERDAEIAELRARLERLERQPVLPATGEAAPPRATAPKSNSLLWGFLVAVGAVILVGGALSLAGQTPTPSTPPASISSSVEAALSACGSSQSAVAGALETSDYDYADSTLRRAEDACREAARSLRAAPLPAAAFDPTDGPASIEQMADSMAQIRTALSMLDRSPKAAQRKARQGMNTYKAALARFNRASHR